MHRKTGSIIIFLAFLMSGVLAWAGPEKLEVSITLSEPGDLQPANWKAAIEFSRPLTVMELTKNLSLLVDGEKASFDLVNATGINAEPLPQPLPAERQVFVIESRQTSGRSHTVELRLAKGLASADNSAALAQSHSIRFESKPYIGIIELNPFYHSRQNRGVSIALSEETTEASLKNHLYVLPPAGRLTIQPIGPEPARHFDVLGDFDAEKTYQLLVRPGLDGESGRMFVSQAHEFEATGLESRLEIHIDRSVIELRSRQLLPVAVTGVDRVLAQVTRIPPLFSPEFRGLSQLAGDDSKRPESSESVNTDKTFITAVSKQILEAEKRIVHGIRRLEEIEAGMKDGLFKGFEPFVGEFSVDSETFFSSTHSSDFQIFSTPLSFRTDPESGGAFLVQLSAPEREDLPHSARLVQITDLAITYKVSGSQLLVWVTSVESGRPVPGVSVLLVDSSDRRILAGKTDADGLLFLEQGANYPAMVNTGNSPAGATATLDIAQVHTIMAADSRDSSFIQIDSNRFHPFQIPTLRSGSPGKRDVNGRVFTERGVYRQGDTVFWKAVARRFSNGSILPPQGARVRVTVIDPTGETISDRMLTLNEFGTCSGEVVISGFAPLGQYEVTVEHVTEDKTGSSKERFFRIASTGFQVQTFEPPRHYVKLSAKSRTLDEQLIPGRTTEQEYLECAIEGKYYTGGPVRHGRVRWTATLVPVEAPVEGFEHLFFGSDSGLRTLMETGEGMLDGNGSLVIALPLDHTSRTGAYGVEITATVLDVDARPATSLITHRPEARYRVGMGNIPQRVSEGDSISLSAMVIDQDGREVKTGSVRMELMQQRYFYYQKRDEDGGLYYRWDRAWQRSQTAVQQLGDEPPVFEILFSVGGEFLVQLVYTDDDNRTYTTSKLFNVGFQWEMFDDEDGRSRRRSDNEITLSVSKLRAAMGETIDVDISTPRPVVAALVTLEREGIFDHRIVKVEGVRGRFSFEVKSEHAPNTFITVTVPAGRTGLPVYRSNLDLDLPVAYYGYANLHVARAVAGLEVEISDAYDASPVSEMRGRPGERKTLQFRVTDSGGAGVESELAVCVVDEAVLALTGFLTPDLTRLLDFSLPISVFTGDLRLSLVTQEIYRLFATRALTGGGMGSGAIAADIDLREDFRPVAYWNPALATDSQGRATVAFDLPDSTTKYRVYVVAVDRKAALASKEKYMVVSKEFFLRPGLPRFFTTGDEVVFNLTAVNRTDRAGQADLAIETASNLTADLAETAPPVEGFSDTTVQGKILADQGPGKASLVFSGRFAGFSDAVGSEVPVISRYTPVTVFDSGSFRGNVKIRPGIPSGLSSIPVKDRESVRQASLSVSATPWSRILPGLQYLISYPHGCIEQVASRVIPLAGLRSLAETDRLPGVSVQELDEMVEAGIEKILSMQTHDGGFAYWDRRYPASWWGTQYALLALTTAQRAGFEVPINRLEAAIRYVRDTLNLHDSSREYYSRGINALSALNLFTYNAVSLAEAREILARFDAECPERTALELLLEAMAGEREPAALLEELGAYDHRPPPGDSSWHLSEHRNIAFALMAATRLDPRSGVADNLAGALLNSLKPDGRWSSTADTGLCLVALADYFQAQKPARTTGPVNVTIRIGHGPDVNLELHDNHETLVLDAAAIMDGAEIEIRSDSEELINWTLKTVYPEPPREEHDLNHGFRVLKRIENLNGRDEIRVGDMVKVTVEFEDRLSQSGRYGAYEYLALEDPLPAGFIAINTALRTEGSMFPEEGDREEWFAQWERGAYVFNPGHMEIHDDQVKAFRDSLWSGRFRLTYFARAVAEGSFHVRPTRLSLMYHPEFYGLSCSDMVTILPAR